MLYITRMRLMVESEQTVLDYAASGDDVQRRVCSQLLADSLRYTRWHSGHDIHMDGVAKARRREKQLLKLRSLAIEQVHRTALVRYLRDHRITGADRDQTLREFYGIADPQDSVLAEHRNYLLAASTQLCTSNILELVGDEPGHELLRRYELAYQQYFAMFCGRLRSQANGETDLLDSLMPEVKAVADRLRLRILDSQLLPTRPISLAGAAAAARIASPARTRGQAVEPAGPPAAGRRFATRRASRLW